MNGFCSEASLAVELSGTAPQVQRWLLIEDAGPWGAKVPQDSTLPAAVRARLDRLGREAPEVRVQLLRPGAAAPRFIYAVDSRPGIESIWRSEIAAAPIEELDPLGLLDSLSGEAFDGPLILVCTHGTRDACCAKWGRAVFQAFEALEPDRVRQSSHLTGHRFASVVAVLPYGLLYGRVQAGDASAILESARKNEIWDLDRFRGRSCDSAPVQAAESLLRRRSGERAIDALHPVECSVVGDQARVLFESAAGSQLVEMRREEGPSAPSSCGSAPEPSVRWVALP